MVVSVAFILLASNPFDALQEIKVTAKHIAVKAITTNWFFIICITGMIKTEWKII
jgi:hypothetical protein